MMRHNYLTALAFCIIFFTAGPSQAAQIPCVSATADCAHWIELGSARALAYSTHPLEARNEKISGALVMVHGAGRNADSYFRTAVKAASLANRRKDTIIVTPRFASNDQRRCKDTLAANEINWPCRGISWRSGGAAQGNSAITSFDLMDEILRTLSRKDLFPNLKAIVLAGHSAGGQFVTRYEMSNRVHDSLGVPLAYIVANPSSYAYPDPNRPVEVSREYRPAGSGTTCKAYDHWPYGLKERRGYSARLTDEQLRKQLVSRPVTYMLGELDTLPLSNFDDSCSAMAQGPNRLARGRAFVDFINQKYFARHKLMVIPACGHSANCMFTEKSALPVLFPKP